MPMQATAASEAHTLEFFFDFSSPWTYMAYTQVVPLCAETGTRLVWRPFYVAAVFRQVNHNVADMRASPVPAKLAYYWRDMQRWAERLGIVIGRPPVYGGGSKPLNSARALRGAFHAIDRGRIREYAGEVFRAYWQDLRDIADPAVLVELAGRAGLDEREFERLLEADETRARLAANTQEFIDRGGFGTPTFFVDGTELYFGNDRLDFVRTALARG